MASRDGHTRARSRASWVRFPYPIPTFSATADLVIETTCQSEENPEDVQLGKQFVVNAVMAGPAWQRTLLIWFYDEHGGYYDHVLPPAAIAPDDIAPDIGPGDQPGGYNPGLVQGYQGQPLPPSPASTVPSRG